MQLPQNCQLVWTETSQNGSKWCRSYLFPSPSHVFSWPNDRYLLLQVSMSPECSPEDFIPCQPAQIGWFKQSVSGWFTRQKCRFGTNRSPFFMGYCRILWRYNGITHHTQKVTNPNNKGFLSWPSEPPTTTNMGGVQSPWFLTVGLNCQTVQ